MDGLRLDQKIVGAGQRDARRSLPASGVTIVGVKPQVTKKAGSVGKFLLHPKEQQMPRLLILESEDNSFLLHQESQLPYDIPQHQLLGHNVAPSGGMRLRPTVYSFGSPNAARNTYFHLRALKPN